MKRIQIQLDDEDYDKLTLLTKVMGYKTNANFLRQMIRREMPTSTLPVHRGSIVQLPEKDEYSQDIHLRLPSVVMRLLVKYKQKYKLPSLNRAIARCLAQTLKEYRD